VQRILQKTGWSELAPGSLNLEVEERVVRALADESPLIQEDPGDITYPPGQEYIPIIRGGYWYYRALVKHGAGKEDALIRRAIKNPLPTRVELLAPVNLKSALGVNDGDLLDVETIGND
jgi:CTP-dependent riboflavin kinase